MDNATTLSDSPLQVLEAAVQPLIERLGEHPLFDSIRTLKDVRCFMEHHVYAVWDFMCLLKALQTTVTCTTVPWLPVGDAGSRRLINEICLDEESDELEGGQCFSHLELYLEAMKEAGARTSGPLAFIDSLRSGANVEEALKRTTVPTASRQFVQHTMAVIESKATHRIAAAFSVGREQAIPVMFTSMVNSIARGQPTLSIFRLYLERHIELDGDKHGPLGMRMLEQLCGKSRQAWQEATESAIAALQARERLWDGVLSAIQIGA